MTTKGEGMFETLDPPPGGLVGLRERIERDGRWRTPRRLVPTVATGILLIVLASWSVVAWPEAPDIPTELDLVRIQLGQLPAPSEAVVIPDDHRGQVAVRRVPLPTDEVVFYLVGSIQE